MKFICTFLLFSIVISCSGIQPAPVLRPDWPVRERIVEESEAIKIIKGKENFLKLTYEQSVNPMFLTPKWSVECIKANSVGSINDQGNALMSVSWLFTDKEFHTGFCPAHENVRRAQFVYLYCKQSKKLLEIRCFENECAENLNWPKLC